MSLGTIKDYTPNFNLIIPEFNISGWHDYLEENFRSIDALFYNLFGINNYSGIWEKLTSYTAGQVVFIGEDEEYSGRLVKVLVDHTTTNDDFSTFFANNPTYYELFADASTAQYYAQQAKDWAVKMDGPVEGSDYSAKYYADLVDNLSTEITALYNIANDIQTVANISIDVENVADIGTNITTVASMQSDINDVLTIKSDIEWIADNDTIVTNVSNNSTKITTVANNISSVNTTATNITDINTVASNQTNINTTATNISAINTNASNITAIQNASTNATNAANSAQSAADSATLAYQYGNDKINQTHITNCITNIPQDIKLELDNGTITLKAGSKIYVPNGKNTDDSNRFDEVIINSDRSATWTWVSAPTFIFYSSASDSEGILEGEIDGTLISKCSSGTSFPATPDNYTIYYRTDENKIYRYVAGTWLHSRSLPIGIMNGSDSVVTSIDQVFNGFGYIGSTVFALPGLKGLIPNGRNEDGTLNNREFTLNNVLIHNFTSIIGAFNGYAAIQNANGNIVPSYDTLAYWTYDINNNIFVHNEEKTSFCYLAKMTTDGSGVITSFNPKPVFHAVDYSDLDNKIQEVSVAPVSPVIGVLYVIPES